MRPQPAPAGRWSLPRAQLGADSFPSGHTALAYGVAAAYSRHHPESRGLAYALAGAVGWSRVAQGSHWPSDVAAGAALGIDLGQRR